VAKRKARVTSSNGDDDDNDDDDDELGDVGARRRGAGRPRRDDRWHDERSDARTGGGGMADTDGDDMDDFFDEPESLGSMSQPARQRSAPLWMVGDGDVDKPYLPNHKPWFVVRACRHGHMMHSDACHRATRALALVLTILCTVCCGPPFTLLDADHAKHSIGLPHTCLCIVYPVRTCSFPHH
jgi:hypothetical protein